MFKKLIIFCFLFLTTVLQGTHCRIVSDLKEHIAVLDKAISISKNELIIVSPFIRSMAVSNGDLLEKLRNLKLKKNVDIIVLTDKNLDRMNGVLKDSAKDGRSKLKQNFVRVIELENIHSKIIISDQNFLVIGSFNWLSASRDPNSQFCNTEHSVVMEGSGIDKEIAKQKEQLRALIVKDQYPSFSERVFILFKKQAIHSIFQMYKANKDRSNRKRTISNLFNYVLSNFLDTDDQEITCKVACFLKDECDKDVFSQITAKYRGNFSSIDELIDFLENMLSIGTEKIDDFLAFYFHDLSELDDNHEEIIEDLSKKKLMNCLKNYLEGLSRFATNDLFYNFQNLNILLLRNQLLLQEE